MIYCSSIRQRERKFLRQLIFYQPSFECWPTRHCMLTNHFDPLSKPVSPEICLSFQPRETLHLRPTLRPRRFSLSAGKDKSGLVFRKSEFGDMDTSVAATSLSPTVPPAEGYSLLVLRFTLTPSRILLRSLKQTYLCVIRSNK